MSDLYDVVDWQATAASAHAQHAAAEERLEALQGEIQGLRAALTLAGDRLDNAADRIDAIGFALLVRRWADEARAVGSQTEGASDA